MLILVQLNERKLQNINSYRNSGACMSKYFFFFRTNFYCC